MGLCFYILRATDWFTAVPGDLGDARFNSIILEHLFQRVHGDWPSLWSPGFFHPAAGSLAFSDNHFGSGLVYVLFRALGLAREPAFDAWLTVGYGLDFVAMYLVTRRLGFSSLAAAVAAFVCTFSLPALAQEFHAQLTYRFAIPLAWLALLQFIQERRLTHLARLAAWGALQFYCSIYLGGLHRLPARGDRCGHAGPGVPAARCPAQARDLRRPVRLESAPGHRGIRRRGRLPTAKTTPSAASMALAGCPTKCWR